MNHKRIYSMFVPLVLLALCLGSVDAFAQSRQPHEWVIAKKLTVSHATSLEATATLVNSVMTPTDTEPTATEGAVYWDDSENAMKHYNGSAWIAITASSVGSGDNTLDLAYRQGGAGAGRAINVNGGAVTMTVGNGDNSVVLAIVQSDATNDPTAMSITNAADLANAISLDIDGQTTGLDVEGTGAAWKVTGLGAATFLSAACPTITSAAAIALTATTDVVVPANVGITFGTGEKIEGDSTDLTVTSGGAIELTAVTDVVVPTSVGVTFGTGEKIEGDDTDLTITSGALINLTATSDVAVPANVGVLFGTGEKIEGDNTDLTVTSGGALNLTATTDVVVPTSVGVTFGTGEKIEGDDTDLTVTSGGAIDLTAVTDVVIPTSVGVTFGAGEKIEGDDTDLTVTSGGLINLTATTDVAIPVNVGLLMAGTEKIESDGTDITITVGAAGDINVGADIGVTFGDDGEIIEGDGTDLSITSSGLLNLTATSGIKTISDLDVDANIVGDGGGTIAGMLRTIVVDANGVTLTIAQSGIVLYATGAGVVELPEASTANGMWFTIVVGATANVDVNPDDADQILLLTDSAGDAIRSGTIGNTVTLLAVDDTNWILIGAEKGTWTDID